MGSAIRFKQSNVPKQQGELARLKVVQGPDYGSIFVILGKKASVGRGEENDIMISDLKASRVHAMLVAVGDGWTVRDQGSANGILVNGQPLREAKLKLKDTLKVGETTLEFVAAEAGTMMLVAPPRDIQHIHAEQAAFEAQRKKARGVGGGAAGTGFSAMFGQSGAGAQGDAGGKKKLVLFGATALLMGILVFGPSDTPQKAKKTKNEADRDLASYLPKGDAPAVNKTAEMFFRSGFREYRERNYLRARIHFETVLQIAPGHRLSTIYLENCNKEIEEEVKNHLEYGKKGLKSGKLKDARGHFEAILRLLHRDQSNAAYIEAKEQFEKADKEIKGGIL